MIDEYFNIFTEKVKEYGPNTVILYQCGSFYEIYEIDNEEEQIGNAKRLSRILEMTYANKRGNTSLSTRAHPNFIGFTLSILDKYLNILLRNGFTVVLVDQLELSAQKKGNLVQRGITKIYSPSLQPADFLSDFNLVSLLFNIQIPIKKSNKKNSSFIQHIEVSICCVNNNNNTIELIGDDLQFTCIPDDPYSLNLSLESISRILYRCNPKELQIIGIPNDFWQIKSYFMENYENVRFNEIENLSQNFQNKFLRDTYDHICFGLIEPIEYFRLNQLSVNNLVYILKFIFQRK